MSAANTNSFEALSAYQVGQVVHAVGAELEEGKTSPPPRYTEDSLISAMEGAWRFAKSKEDRAMLKQTEGIGTARTRQPTLANLLKRKLLESKKNGKRYELRSMPLGRDIIGRLPVWLTDVSTTAKWEMLLDAIEKGEASPESVLESQIQYVRQVIDRAKTQMPATPPATRSPPARSPAKASTG